MKLLDKRLLFRYIIINIIASSSLVFLLWYTGKFVTGILSYVKLVLYIPSFFILVFLKGLNETMHFTTYKVELLVSFIFYSLVIALIQVLIYKMRKKKSDHIHSFDPYPHPDSAFCKHSDLQ
jgi:hypothetical protein